MMIDEFQKKLRWFVARRGKAQVIISDNAKTLNAAKKWLECFKKSEDVNSCLSTERIKWQHNLSSSPWWGGLFERMIGVMTYALSKAIGNAMLTFEELEDILLDVECFMNDCPLVYIGEEFDRPVIIPNILIRGERNTYLEENNL